MMKTLSYENLEFWKTKILYRRPKQRLVNYDLRNDFHYDLRNDFHYDLSNGIKTIVYINLSKDNITVT